MKKTYNIIRIIGQYHEPFDISVSTNIFDNKLPINENDFNEIIIPDNVTDLSAIDFSNFPNLKKIKIPNNVTSIPEKTFIFFIKMIKFYIDVLLFL